MVYIEDMYLRGGGEQGCVDTVQFGVEDKIPFVTFKKTKKLCGALTDWSWDVEDGGLIIWLNLEKNRPEYHRNLINTVLSISNYAPKNSPPTRIFKFLYICNLMIQISKNFNLNYYK